MNNFQLGAIIAQKRNADGTFDAEVALTVYNGDASVALSTEQRVVKKSCATRVEAEDVAVGWLSLEVFPIFQKLPKAKP